MSSVGTNAVNRTPSTRRMGGSVLIAFLIHVLVIALLPSIAELEAALHLQQMDFEIVESPPVAPDPPAPETPEPPRPDPVPPEPTAPPPPPRPRPRAEAPPPTPPDAPPVPPAAPAEETPVRMAGVTLTSPGAGPGFAVDPGSGEDRQGPLSPPGLPNGRRVHGVPGGQPGGTGTAPGPRVVPLADLSRPPRAPNLDGRLQREYPDQARRQGVQGTATLRARVEPNGHIGRMRGASASIAGYGFAEACERVLRGSRWSAPLDHDGRPVAVWITYRCRFSVR